MSEKIMSSFMCVAKFRPKAERRDDLLARLKSLIPLTRAEAGCLGYDLCFVDDGDFPFMMVEQFTSRADFDTHSKADYLVSFVSDLGDLVDDVVVYVSEQTILLK